MTGFIWKCECGNIEHDEEVIEECTKCSRLDSFVKIPKDVAVDISNEDVDELDVEDEIPKIKAPKAPKMKSKSKSGRKK